MKAFALPCGLALLLLLAVLPAGCGSGAGPSTSPATEPLAEHISKAHGFLIEEHAGPQTAMVAHADAEGGVDIQILPRGVERLRNLSHLHDAEIFLVLKLNPDWKARFASEEDYVAWLGDLHGFIGQYNPDRTGAPPAARRDPSAGPPPLSVSCLERSALLQVRLTR